VSDKTEEATPRRLRKAQEEGDSGSSAFAAQSLAFLVAVAIVPVAVRALVLEESDALRSALNDAASRPDVLRFDRVELALTVLKLVLPLVTAVGLVAAVAHLVQTGAVFASKRLALKPERLNPFEGFRNLFSSTRLFAVVRALVAAGVVGWLGYSGLRDHVVDLARLGGRLQWAPTVVAQVAGALAWRAALVGLGLGLLDLLVTRAAWRRRLRMGKDEVKREHKDNDGDPQLKAARDRAHHEMLAQVTVANVRQASVVIVNPTHLACALRYDEQAGDEAPVVVASGRGDLAAQIIRAADQWGIPVLQDVPLAHVLIELQIGEAIPEALYEAVAEILREIQLRQAGRNAVDHR
jgi:flagellar biosynthesis protein FlhB